MTVQTSSTESQSGDLCDRPPAIVWFREDLRLADNPALQAALEGGRRVLCVYILDPRSPSRALGGASRWWLHHSLSALSQSLSARGGRLDLFMGEPHRILESLTDEFRASSVYWTRRYDGAGVEIDRKIKESLAKRTSVVSFNGKLLVEPWRVKTRSGQPFRVFTPFWRAAREAIDTPRPLPAPQRICAAPEPGRIKSASLSAFALLPVNPDWAAEFRETWRPGEDGAQAALQRFLEQSLAVYASERDRPDKPSTSRLSPHLAFGEISPQQIWAATRHAAAERPTFDSSADKFLSEVGWREFSYHLLFYNPDLATKNFNAAFDAFSWPTLNVHHLSAWKKGLTGYPIVDAGMRELWATGTMHNRVRMIAASLLIKHLMIDWRLGEQWFWDCLCDADPANNPASWQWVAGTGADAAPYFRVFNPTLQGEKFDSEGAYVKRWVPELAALPTPYIHQPARAPADVLARAGIVLGQTYPMPIVEHDQARKRALAAFQALKNATLEGNAASEFAAAASHEPARAR